MISGYRLIFKALALLVTFSVMQVYVLAGPSLNFPVSQANGTIQTTNNQPILVNGNSTPSGTTILPGSTIETPDGVSAKLSLGFADLEIAPGSEVLVEFAADGSVKVTLKKGCARLKKKDGTSGEILTPDGTTTKTDNDGNAAVCFPLGATSPTISAGAGVAGGLSDAAWAAIILSSVGGGGLVLYLATRGDNSSDFGG
jgi:hypothetical protein